MSFKNKQKIYKEVFESNAGKKVLADLAIFCGQYAPTYQQGDPYDTAYKEGMRRVYLRIHSYLNMDHAEVDKIINSYRKETY